MKVWKYLLVKPKQGQKLDLADELVTIGPYTIQGGKVFGLPDGIDNVNAILDIFRGSEGVLVDIQHTGTRTGYGHGRETLRLLNRDGSLIYKRDHIDHCDGPGYSCSYSHGPWEKYGSYNGTAKPDPELQRALDAKQQLEQKFRF